MTKGFARTFGQDLMRKEHIVGGGQAVTEQPRYAGGLADGLVALRAAEKRGETTSFQGQEQSGTSIFDPVLCELAYQWFCPSGGRVLDPFAGGSVRGIVAHVLGRQYTGIELRPEQCAANEQQSVEICEGGGPVWLCGDAHDVLPALAPDFDFLFSCPPYGNLEIYSDDPRDLSAMSAVDFDRRYAEIIRRAVDLLRPDSFAAFVVGNYRGADGFYRDLCGLTVRAFEAAGARYYNEAVLVTAAGSLPIRVGRQFSSARKLGKTHQNFLGFCKGSPKRAADRCGPIDFFFTGVGT